MQLFRIADARHPIWDATGAASLGGRWNIFGERVIYASPSYSCAMLEILAHANIGRVPRNQMFVRVDLPGTLRIERFKDGELPNDWDAQDCRVASQFGSKWLKEARSAILLVPSVVARLDFIAVVNPTHPDAKLLKPTDPENVVWNERLFR